MKALKVTEHYKYLGNAVSASRTKGSTVQELQRGIAELSRAPLKPEQRLFILRTNLIPSLAQMTVTRNYHYGRDATCQVRKLFSL